MKFEYFKITVVNSMSYIVQLHMVFCSNLVTLKRHDDEMVY